MRVDPWYLLNSGAGPHDFNMAQDEALLEGMPRLGRPVLRFYGWTEPAASFGYFQRFTEIERLTPLRPLVRRPTAGGLVPHAADWTYSVAFPTSHPWYGLTASESYWRMHQWIHDALEMLEMTTELAPEANRAKPGQCFVGFERYDLLWQGRKIAGAAQRRRRDGLLIQGSVQPPAGWPHRPAWEQAMCKIAAAQQRVLWTPLPVEAWLHDRVVVLARTRYSQASYNRKR